MEKQEELGPLFKDVRQRHQISLTQIIENLLKRSVDKQIYLSFDAVQLFDQCNIGREEIVDAMIASLNYLTGEHYTCENVGDIAFIPHDTAKDN